MFLWGPAILLILAFFLEAGAENPPGALKLIESLTLHPESATSADIVVLEAYAKELDMEVRRSALDALSAIGNPAALASLRRVRDHFWSCYAEALLHAAVLQDPLALDELVGLARSEPSDRRLWALAVLIRRMGDQDAIGRIESLIEEDALSPDISAKTEEMLLEAAKSGSLPAAGVLVRYSKTSHHTLQLLRDHLLRVQAKDDLSYRAEIIASIDNRLKGR